MLHGRIYVLLHHFFHLLWQPVLSVVWSRIPDLISLALHSNLHVPINMESAFRLLPTRLDAVSMWILTRLLSPHSLHKTNSMLPILAAQCYSLSPSPWSQACNTVDRAVFNWQSEWSGKAEWWKCETKSRRCRGCLTHHGNSCRTAVYPCSVIREAQCGVPPILHEEWVL